MNAPSSIRPVHGKVDDQGRLVEADPPLRHLQERAGGVPGGALAIPQLASLVRLARRLRIAISRRVLAASGDQDVDLWVQVTPQDGGVVLAISGWQESAAAVPSPALEAVRWRDFSRASADWIIETDAMLRVTQPPANMPGAIGQPIEALFTLSCDERGVTRIAEAARRAERCEDDAATFLVGSAHVPVRIAGVPLIDGIGALAGYQLLISRRDPLAAPRFPDPPPLDEAFGTQLGRAMREPLDRIIANADAIQDRGDGPVRRDYADYAEDIAGAGRHLLALVDDLVDLQTIERPDFRPEAEPVDLVDTALRAAGLLGVRAAGHQVRIDPPAAGQAVTACGDFRRILQVLINLLSNAIRHSPAGGTVRIRCEREGDIAAVIVADAGEGIAPEHHERIFDRFERLGLRDGTGSGLGLYISRRLARAMGGDLGVDSAPGKGARFVFTLPAGD
jgi:signal transduction histidine kinase